MGHGVGSRVEETEGKDFHLSFGLWWCVWHFGRDFADDAYRLSCAGTGTGEDGKVGCFGPFINAKRSSCTGVCRSKGAAHVRS